MSEPEGARPPLLGRPWAWAIFATVALAFPALLLWGRAHREPLPVYFSMPEFALVDQDEQPVSSADLRGEVLVVDFIFTSCPDVCPLLTQRMADLQGRLTRHERGVPVRLVSISIDPARDTPAALREFADQYGARPERWTFLTGDPTYVADVVAGFKMAAQKVVDEGEDYHMVHSEKFLLVDADGAVRGFYTSDAVGLASIVSAVRALAATGGR